MVRQETEDALSILMWLLGKLETRWTAATAARANFELIMRVLGEQSSVSRILFYV